MNPTGSHTLYIHIYMVGSDLGKIRLDIVMFSFNLADLIANVKKGELAKLITRI